MCNVFGVKKKKTWSEIFEKGTLTVELNCQTVD